MCWLAAAFDARLARNNLGRQSKRAENEMGSIQVSRAQAGLRPVIAVVGLMQVLCGGIGAAILGRLATLRAADTAAVFETFPLAHASWGWILGCGPTACVVLALVGAYCVNIGINAGKA